MADKDFDAAAFRKLEYDGWNRLSAGYHDHWQHLTTQIIPPLLAGTGVGEGCRVLDVASGPGYVAAAAAALGATARGVDLCENMRDLALENYPDIAFELADAEALPFADESFDAVLINFGVLHFPDADKALGEAFRVLRTGGRLGFTSWAPAERSAIAIAMAAIGQEGAVEVDLPAGTPVFRFADPAECDRALSGIGFADVSCSDFTLTWRLPRPDALMESFHRATARISALLDAQEPGVLPAIAAAMARGCRPYVKDGNADLPMPAALTVATKP